MRSIASLAQNKLPRPTQTMQALFLTILLMLVVFAAARSSVLAANSGQGEYLCGHVHDEACGYREASAGSPCTHVCDDSCYTQISVCAHVCDEGCWQTVPACQHICDEACAVGCTHFCDDSCYTQVSACAHLCDEGCWQTVPACQHLHDESCGYAAAVEAAPCTHICSILSFEGYTSGQALLAYTAADGQTYADIAAALPALLPGTLSCVDHSVDIPLVWSCEDFSGQPGEYIFRAVVDKQHCVYGGELPLALVTVPAPADEILTPADETLTPEDETLTPADETLTPEDETLAPDDEVTTPTDETAILEDEAITPADAADLSSAQPLLEATLSDPATGISVSGLLPVGAELSVRPLSQEEFSAYVDEGVQVVFAYDIKILLDGAEYQPGVENPLLVAVTPATLPEDAVVEVTHVQVDDSSGQLLSSHSLTDVTTTDSGTVEFSAESFSIYIGTTPQYLTLVGVTELYYKGSKNSAPYYFYSDDSTTINYRIKDANGVYIEDLQTILNHVAGDLTIYMMGAGYTVSSGSETIDGGSVYEVTLKRYNSTNGLQTSLVTVASGAELTLSNIIIDGGAVWSGPVDATLGRGTTNDGLTATAPAVSVSGQLTLNAGVRIQNNYNSIFDTGKEGGGVNVTSSGSLTMNGGAISNNCNYDSVNVGTGGGVCNKGMFSLTGGTLSGNAAYNSGGVYNFGVNDDSPASFSMSGGTITANKADSTLTGGGFAVGSGVTFTLSGGKVYGNTAQSGWGIYMERGGSISGGTVAETIHNHYSGTLTITGGSIAGISNYGTVIDGSGGTPTLHTVTLVDAASPATEPVQADTAVAALGLSAGSYGLNDVYTDAAGQLYLWLPAATTASSATADSKTFFGASTSGGTAVFYSDITSHIFVNGSLTTGNNDGSSPDNAYQTYAQVVTATAGAGSYTVIVCGATDISAMHTIATGVNISLTSVWGGTDYRATNGAMLRRAVGFTTDDMFEVTSGGSLTLTDVTLDGNKDNVICPTKCIVYANGGSLTMNSGAVVKDSYINGVYANTKNGSVIMNGGTISGNGNVGLMVHNSNCTINDGTISDNVVVGLQIETNNSACTINGGTISGNTTGVNIISSGICTLSGGTISGNTTGVNISSDSTFTLATGGSISLPDGVTLPADKSINAQVGFSVSSPIPVTLEAAPAAGRTVVSYDSLTTEQGLAEMAKFSMGRIDYMLARDANALALAISTNTNVVYLNGQTGLDTNNGSAPALAVKTLDQAYTLLPAGGTVYISGQVDITSAVTLSGASESGIITFLRYSQPTIHDGEVDDIETVADPWPASYTGILFNVKNGATLTLTNITIDGHKDAVTGTGTVHDALAVAAAGPLVKVDAGGTLNLQSGATLQNNSNSQYGGGAWVYGTLNMSDGVISDNVCAQDGGGVNVTSTTGRFNLTGGTITGNSTTSATWTTGGGGVTASNGAVFSMSGGEISDNHADNGTNATGGGVFLSGGSTVFDMTGGSITGNTAGQGGGIYVYSATFTLSGSGTVSGNSVTKEGGAVRVFQGTFNLNGGTVSGNTAPSGGGVYSNTGTFTMTGGTVSGNTAITEAGGLYLVGTNTISGGVISENSAVNGGGVWGSVTMSGGEIKNNVSTGTGDGTGGGGIHLSDNGSMTMTGGVITGNRSARNGGGVYGRRVTFNLSGSGVISGNTAVGTGGGVFISSLYGNPATLTMSGGEITGNSALNGGGVGSFKSTLSMSGGSIAENNTVNGGGVYVQMGTVDLSGGAVSENEATGDGGGIYLTTDGYGNGSSMTMTGGVIDRNTATGNGGGIYAWKGTIPFSGGTISGNSAANGGGVFATGESTGLSTLTVSGGTIDRNTVTGNGSGIYPDEYSTFNLSGSPTILDTVYLPSGKYINVDTTNGAFTPAVPVPVTSAVATADTLIAEYGSAIATAADCAKFRLSDAALGLAVNSNDTSQLVIDTGGRVMYVNLNGTGDGLTPRTPCMLAQAYVNLQSTGGTVFIVHNVRVVNGSTLTLSSTSDGITTLAEGKHIDIVRYSKPTDASCANWPASNTDYLFCVEGTLNLSDIVIDGHRYASTSTNPELSCPGVESNKALIFLSYSPDNPGELNISAGTVLQNNNNISNTYYGGVVYNAYGVTNMTGGILTGNTSIYGGGVYIEYEGRFNLSGGSVSGNTATSGAGFYMNNDFGLYSQLHISGAPSVDADQSVYLRSNAVKIDVDAAYSGSPLTVTGNSLLPGVTIATYDAELTPDLAYFNVSSSTVRTRLSGQNVELYTGATLTAAAEGVELTASQSRSYTFTLADYSLTSGDLRIANVTATPVVTGFTQAACGSIYQNRRNYGYTQANTTFGLSVTKTGGTETDTYAADYTTPISLGTLAADDTLTFTLYNANAITETGSVGTFTVTLSNGTISIPLDIVVDRRSGCQLSVTVPASITAALNGATGQFTFPTDTAILNYSAAPVRITSIDWNWDETNMDDLFIDRTKLIAQITLGSSLTYYQFSGTADPTPGAPGQDGRIGAHNGLVPGSLPLNWTLTLGSGNGLNYWPGEDVEVGIATVTYTLNLSDSL